MKKFVVKRNFPGAVNLFPKELQDMSQASGEAIVALGIPYHWFHSYITGDKIYCVHMAESEEVIRQHASLGKFTINTGSEVKTIADPSTSNCLGICLCQGMNVPGAN